MEEAQTITMDEFVGMVTSSARRKLKRGFTSDEKILLQKIENGEKDIETHCRDMIILPVMLGTTIKVHTGREFVAVAVDVEKLGHRLGEFALTRKNIAHSAPGVGATRSSAAVSVK